MGQVLSGLIKNNILLHFQQTFADKSLEIMKKMDGFTITLVAIFPQKIMTANEHGEGGTQKDLVTEVITLGWKQMGEWADCMDYLQQPIADTTIQAGPYPYKMLLEDDIFGTTEREKKILLGFLRDSTLYPLTDKIFFESDDVASILLEDLQLAPGMAMSVPYHEWNELWTDEGMSRLFFYGLGSVMLQDATSEEDKSRGVFVADMANLEHLDVRPGFSRYGARLLFDKNQNLTAIYNYATQKLLVKPEDPYAKNEDTRQWAEAKYIARQTLGLVATAHNHLLWSHLLCANTVTRASNLLLPPSHPIRRLLGPFTFRSNYINNSATETLLPVNSLFHRATALEYESVGDLMGQGVKKCNIFEPFPDRDFGPNLTELGKDGKFPYYSDGVAYYGIVREFVKAWVEASGKAARDDYAKAFYNEIRNATLDFAYQLPEFEQDESMIDLISQMIFVVTAYHELVGTVADYTQRPSFVGLRAADGATSTDLQSFVISACITALTGIVTPRLMGPFQFGNYFSQGGAPAWEHSLWQDFQQQLKDQRDKVHELNQDRKYPFRFFNPEQFECSISV